MKRSEKMRLNLERRRNDYDRFVQRVTNAKAYRRPGSNKK